MANARAAEGGRADGTVTCAWCGRTEPSMPLTWTSSTDSRGRTAVYCEQCSRENLRAIEGRLDAEWW